MSARGFLGAGDLYIARYNPTLGAFDNYDGPFEATKFEIKPNTELKEMSSRGRTTYGQVIESVPLPKPAEFTLTLAEVNRESLTMALFGTATTVNQGSGTVTDEVIAAKLDKWVQLANQNVTTAGFVVTDTTAATTYVLGTDYEVNYTLGMIRIKSGRGIAADASLKVDYGYSAISGTKIAGATQTQVRARLKLDGVNFADQLPVIAEIWEAVLASDTAFDFMADDFAEITLKGKLKTPVGKTEPFVVELRTTA